MWWKVYYWSVRGKKRRLTFKVKANTKLQAFYSAKGILTAGNHISKIQKVN